MISNLIDISIRQAPIAFCVALVGITIHAIAEVPAVQSDRTTITAERSHYNSALNLVTFQVDPDGKHRTTGPCKILIVNAGKAGLKLPTQ